MPRLVSQHVFRFECLEPRCVLAGGPIISEFVASNDDSLIDRDGDSSDWIELFNPHDKDLSLDGWYLTDDAAVLTKWSFPTVTLEAKQRLVVFASGKDEREPDNELHTNFKLRASGEYLAIVDPSLAVIDDFGPVYPPQSSDVSYGNPSVTSLLLNQQAGFKYWLPQSRRDNRVIRDWTTLEFDDSTWNQSPNSVVDGIGAYAPLALQGLFQTDVSSTWQSATVLLRQEFNVDSPQDFDGLMLRMQYEDGFVVYLNGVEVAAVNVPELLLWDSIATSTRPSQLAQHFEEFDISEHLPVLREGPNILQIHGLNQDFPADGTGFLIRPELVGLHTETKDGRSAYLRAATPGSINHGIAGPRITFSEPSSVMEGPFSLVVNVEPTSTQLHFTTDGTQPSRFSPVLKGPIEISSTTHVQVIAITADGLSNRVAKSWYVVVEDETQSFSSNLPIVVLDNFGAARPMEDDFQLNAFALFEPDQATGRVALGSPAVVVSNAGLRVRGTSTANREKASYSLEFWDGLEKDVDLSVLGMPAESDWVLLGPYDHDRTLMRTSLINELSRQIGRYAPRTRFVEVFHNMDRGDVSLDDYRGVYLLMEKVKIGQHRVDIEKMTIRDHAAPKVTGGWLLKIDQPDPGDEGFTAGGRTIRFVDPKEQNVTPEQRQWISGFLDEMADSFDNPHPKEGYAKYIDVDSWIDHHLLRILSGNADSLVLSTYFYKDRNGRVSFGPLWDSDRTMGWDNSRFSSPYGWHPNADRAFEGIWWKELFEHEGFAHRWVERWQELRQTTLTLDHLQSLIDSTTMELGESQLRNFERWPDVAPTVQQFSAAGLEGWDAAVSHLKGWLRERTTWIDNRFVRPPLISSSHHGFQIASTAPNVYYTLDGTDPRSPDGSISAGAILLDTDIISVRDAMITARAFDPGAFASGRKELSPWSGLSQIVAQEIRGDLNSDRKVDSIDIDVLHEAIRNGFFETRLDLNRDELVDDNDVTELVQGILQTNAGDVNLDRVFDSQDLVSVFLKGEYEDETAGNSSWSDGDWNGDGEFDSSDLVTAFRTGQYSA